MYRDKYETWINSSNIDDETKKELLSLKDEKEIEDRFYKDLEFGTGGLRGIIGAGTNRMNAYTVGKATQGLADYLKANYGEDNVSVCIAYDSRIMSREFATSSALNLCSNNIKVYLYESLRPTPMLSYAVRTQGSKAGIVITASHNPKIYNGYKVYGEDGGQLTDKAAGEVLGYINDIRDFESIKTMDFQDALNRKMLIYVGSDLDESYYSKVKSLAIRKELIKEKASDLCIVYTPIHGAGNIPVRTVLDKSGFTNLYVVKEQELPDGNFPTAPYPNPEEPKVFELAVDMAKKLNADLVFGTDPDCDRIGVVVRDNMGEFIVLTGNQLGILLSHYILSSMKELGILPTNGVIIKTIVSTDMVQKIADEYNVEICDVLTGFKYIGEKIKEYETLNSNTFLFGFEESYGYLCGNFVRDKDAVIASLLVSEMALYYKNKGMTLYDALQNLYKVYGYYKEDLISISLSGKEGQDKIENSMELLRHSMKSKIGQNRIIKKQDYKLSVEKDIENIEEKIINLPKSNVLKFTLEDNSWFVVRPSGTEPKIKIYLSAVGSDMNHVDNILRNLRKEVLSILSLN